MPSEDQPGDESTDEVGSPPPEDVVEEAERLTRLAREAIDDAEAEAYCDERDDLLATHSYESRVRENDDTLVLYPAEWTDEGTIDVDRVEDVSRGVEVPLSGPGDSDDWEAIETHNRGLAESVADDAGEPHASTAHALADFAGNHYAKPIEELTADELREFREAYLPRNAWPSEEQLASVDETAELIFDVAGARRPREASTRDD